MVAALRRGMKTVVLGVFAISSLMGCLAGDGEDDFDDGDDDGDLVDTAVDPTVFAAHTLTAGVNGSQCIASPFNCRFHDGGSRVETAAGGDTWGIEPGASVRDGNGHVLYTEKGHHMTFNYGQTRHLAGKTMALALTTSNGSAGWYPLDHITSEASFRAHNGNVDAKDTGDAHMACYEIRNSNDDGLVLKKVVYNSKAKHERAGDYLPLVRTNGERSANLIFSVPGFGLGGATTDHFRAGTKFRRISVPTSSGKPSISIPLYVKDGNGDYKKKSGTMRFLYGYIRAEDGVKRFGWMAQDALKTSSGCP